MTQFVKLETIDDPIYVNPAHVQMFYLNPEFRKGSLVWIQDLGSFCVNEGPEDLAHLLVGFRRTDGGWTNL